MTVVGIDDTDSRVDGMCTTYVGTRLAERLLERGATVTGQLLYRLNPAIPFKTRGNAAVAIQTDADPETAVAIGAETIERYAVTDDPDAQPGLVVADAAPDAIPDPIVEFSAAAVRERLTVESASQLIRRFGFRHRTWAGGRGLVGALAAVGAWQAQDDWTVEFIGYRHSDRWGTERAIDAASVFEAAEMAYPTVWDTVDRGTGDIVCVPRTPCPVLFGIRGDEPDAVRTVARRINGEPVDRGALFVTNQGTDAHLTPTTLDSVRPGRAFRVEATVAGHPTTRTGGHVFVPLVDDGHRSHAVAFEPTKRFRHHVRHLQPGDRVTVCGEVANGTIKLEKFAVRSLTTTRRTTPTCPGCDRSMKSAGRRAGYRCRECGTRHPGPAIESLDRQLEPGWYEVPPVARRHIAKPLVRGGFDATVHPER